MLGTMILLSTKNNPPIFFRFSLNEALKWLEKGISDFSFSCVVA